MTEDTDAIKARNLAERMSLGTLSTLAIDPAGYPFGSVMTYVINPEGDPVLLASTLAEHTTNFAADPRASLMIFEDPGQGDPLAFERVTLIGDIEKGVSEAEENAYLAVHPHATGYSKFPDFSFYKLRLNAVRYVGGFGRMSWVGVDEFRSASGNKQTARA